MGESQTEYNDELERIAKTMNPPQPEQQPPAPRQPPSEQTQKATPQPPPQQVAPQKHKLVKVLPSETSLRPSFDGIVSKVLDQKFKQIDEEATEKKQLAEEKLYRNLLAMIESASADAPIQHVQPAPVACPTPIPTTTSRPTPAVRSPAKPKMVFDRTGKVLVVLGTILIIVIAMFVAIKLTSGTSIATQNIGNTAFIATVNLGVYTDQACTKNATVLDWGTVHQGESIVKTLYVQNSGSANQTLSMVVSSWNPTSMSQYVGLKWNATNYMLPSGQVVAVTFVMSVASNAPGGFFSNLVTISGPENV